MKLKYLGFIPARQGSKGIPRKNMAPLGGHPLIFHTLKAAQEASVLDDIFLSTDAPEIIEYARQSGIRCDYRRPPELATDQSSSFAAVEHGLEWLRQKNIEVENLVLLQPTSPLRTADDIEASVREFERSRSDSLISVCEVLESPFQCLAVPDGKPWEYLKRAPAHYVRRQDYREKFYFINGAIYINRVASLLKTKSFVEEGKSAVYHMPRERSVDIDSPLDLLFAEAILRTNP